MVAAKTEKTECNDFACPNHGDISLRGRTFKGTVVKKFPKRIVIEFLRTIYIKKYERYSKRKTKLHARLPDCMSKDVEIGDYVEIKECRPISKIIHFVCTGKADANKGAKNLGKSIKGTKVKSSQEETSSSKDAGDNKNENDGEGKQ